MGLVERFRSGLRGAGWEPGDPVVLAVSGGADSMGLLELAVEAGLHGVVGHVNYGLRGAASAGDARWVAREAARKGWPCRVAHRPVGAGRNGLQAEARGVRYRWLGELAGQIPNAYILTAHHADDQAESVVLHWLRAADPVAAVAGMPPRNGRVLRPLLGVRREELRSWAAARGVQWREDASNAEGKYLRNRIRHEVLPLLEDVRAGAIGHLAALAGRGREVAEGMAAVKASAQADPGRLAWTPDAPFFTERLHAWGRLHGVGGDALRALKSTGAHVPVEAGRIVRDRDALVFEATEPLPEPVGIDRPKGSGRAGGVRWEVLPPPADPRAPEGACWVDADRVVWPLTLRPWQPGDALAPYGHAGHVNVSDLLTQAKVPAARRAHHRVLADAAGTIHWLVGFRTAREAALTPQARTAVCFTLETP